MVGKQTRKNKQDRIDSVFAYLRKQVIQAKQESVFNLDTGKRGWIWLAYF